MIRFRMVHVLVRAVLVVTPIGLAGGCVSTTLDLAANHPARPGAVAGATSDPAAVLRPDAALDRSVEPAATAVTEVGQPDGTRENPFVGRGVIRNVAAAALVIQHEPIPGFMGAMTMSYPVAEDVEVEDLEAGDSVTFRVEVPESGGYRVFSVETIPSQGETHEHGAREPEPPHSPERQE